MLRPLFEGSVRPVDPVEVYNRDLIHYSKESLGNSRRALDVRD